MIEVIVKITIKNVILELTEQEVKELYETLTKLVDPPKPLPLPSGPIYRDDRPKSPLEYPYRVTSLTESDNK